MTAGNDRMVYLWDCYTSTVVRSFSLSAMPGGRVSMTAMGKHITVTTIDGRVIVIETLTGVQWRIERVIGSTQAGAAVGMSNFIMEMAPEG